MNWGRKHLTCTAAVPCASAPANLLPEKLKQLVRVSCQYQTMQGKLWLCIQRCSILLSCLIGIDSVGPSPVKGLKKILLPRFLVHFCAKFHLQTELEPWLLANTCIFLFRAYWTVWGTFPVLQLLAHCRRRWELAGFSQPGACARQPQGMQDPSPPSSFVLPIHCSALFNHTEGGRELFPAFWETFHGTGKGLSLYFSEGGFGSQVGFLS